MDRRILTAWATCLSPLASATLCVSLLAAEPSGFAWQSQGPAWPGQAAAQPSAASRPRYDETYPPLRNEYSAAAPQQSGPTFSTAPPQASGPAPAVAPVVRAVDPVVARNISPGLAAASRQTELHVRRGTELGNRRAYYSARAEFIQALRVMAQSLDVEHRTDGHSQALSAGLKALDESDHFIARGQTFESELNVARISAVHRTPVVRSDAESLTPREALERYYTYAQEQLATSMGSEPAGSAALTALGKLYSVLAEEQPTEVVAAQAKAMALHQAALVVHVNNPVAANELGVLLVRFGRHQDAQAWLEHSASLASEAATWHNLAVLHQQMGQTSLAEQARTQEASVAQRTGKRATSAMPNIRWVSPRELDAVPADRPASPATLPAAPANTRPPMNLRTETSPAEHQSVARRPGIAAPGAPTF